MWILLAVIVCFVFVPVFLAAPGMDGRRRLRPFLGVKWAHRGLHDSSAGIPENSLPAFAAAVKAGVGIELDVHLTKDKKIVVFHDDTFERMCGHVGSVEEKTYEEMKHYTLGGTQERIPLLSDVLGYVNGRVPLLIEVKLPSANTEICACLSDVLNGYRGRYLVQSFNCFVLRWLKKNRSDIPRGQLSADLTRNEKTPHFILRFCVKYLLSNFLCRPDFISYRWADRENPGFWLNRVVFRAPSAVWTLYGDEAVRRASEKFDMFIFERTEGAKS